MSETLVGKITGMQVAIWFAGFAVASFTYSMQAVSLQETELAFSGLLNGTASVVLANVFLLVHRRAQKGCA